MAAPETSRLSAHFVLPLTVVGSPNVVSFAYRNWRGEVARRSVVPCGVEFRATEWHPEPQWLLRAIDVDKGEERLFALRDMEDMRYGR